MTRITLKTILSSVEDLAISTQNGFLELEKNLRREINRVEIKVDNLEFKIDKIDKRLEIVEGVRYNSHETRIENLEDSMRTIKNKLKLK